MFNRANNVNSGNNGQQRERAAGFININILDTKGKRRRVGYVPLVLSDVVQAQVYERLMSIEDEEARAAELKRLASEVFEFDFNPIDSGDVVVDF